MILKCPSCQTQYKLSTEQLGVAGREVRCVTCSHTWFQLPEEIPVAAGKVEAAGRAPAQSITEALDSILQKDDAAFSAILSGVAGKETVSKQAAAAAPPVVAAQEKKRVVPHEAQLPVVTNNPFGVTENMFGLLVFALLLFVTLGVIFAFKSPIVHRWPQMAVLYKSIGFGVSAPGEGLQISEVTAERRIDDHSKVLVVEGKMTNMTEHALPYPALHLTAKNDMGLAVKSWDMKPGASEIASGDAVPVMLQLNDMPDDGTNIEMHVKE
jgi:predicted Zn finger-like uncharacterized protein